MNDLPSVLKVLLFCLFADDTSIHYEAKDLISLQKIMNRELKKVRKWLETNRLALNISKTNFVLFHSPSKKINDFIRIRLGRKTITRLNHVKYLRILIDSALSWKPHLTELSKNLARNCGIFYKIRHFVKADTLKLLYHFLFYSFLSYGVTVWGLRHPSITNPL